MTRNEILDASAQIFSQKGYHGTSMQDIAIAVNLQKASLYHHVSSKQEILFDLLNRGLDILITQVEEAIDEPGSADERLRRATCAYLTTMTEYQDLASVLLLEYRSLEPDYHDRHIPRRDRFEQIWRDLIREGMEDGIYTCDHPSLSARALLGVLNWTVTWFRNDGPLSAEEIADQISNLFLMGLITRDSVLEVD
ncbi:MAG: TetR/AcrR family transcriptional regulator [Anaerolineales bacterium]